MIEHVEHLRANLKRLAFVDLEVLSQRMSRLRIPSPRKLREVSRRIARNVVSGVGKTVLIEVGCLRSGRILIIQCRW